MSTLELLRDLDQLSGNLFSTRPMLRDFPMDVYKQGDQYVMSADLPGIDPGSVDIEVDGRQLTIRAERNLVSQDDIQWLKRERTSGSFVRQLTLGEAIDTERIEARYANGILNVIMPVRESAKPRKVSVQTESEHSALSAHQTSKVIES